MPNDTTPVRAGAVNVPLGHVIGSEKWKGSQIAQEMHGKLYFDKITEFCLPTSHPKIWKLNQHYLFKYIGPSTPMDSSFF